MTADMSALAEEIFMRNVYEVLREKELEIQRLLREVAALRLAAPLLQETQDAPVPRKSVQRVDTTATGVSEELGPSLVYESARRKVAATAKRISSRMKRMANPLPTPVA